jgi:hypothetical protein
MGLHDALDGAHCKRKKELGSGYYYMLGSEQSNFPLKE